MPRSVVALGLLFACAACTASSAATSHNAVRPAMPVTFPDGSSTTLHFASGLRLRDMTVRPSQWGRIGEVERDLDITSHPQPAGLPGIRLRFGPWYVRIWDYRPSDRHPMLTHRQRQIWETHLHGKVTADGLLVLSATPPLVLGRPTTTDWGPRLLFADRRQHALELQPGRCDAADDRHGAGFTDWCLTSQIRALAAGDSAFQRLARRSLSATALERPAG